MSNPKLITIKSDGNILEFVTVVKTGVNGIKLPEPLYLYKYSKSITKQGQDLLLTAKQIEALQKINNNE